jgi:hypothetical protein
MSEDILDGVYALQRDRRRRWVATALAGAIGLALASLHWTGLLLGGALVGWCWPTLGRGLLAGLAFGVLVLVAFALTHLAAGTLETALGMAPITYVTLVMPLVLGPLGGLSRGLARNAPRE